MRSALLLSTMIYFSSFASATKMIDVPNNVALAYACRASSVNSAPYVLNCVDAQGNSVVNNFGFPNTVSDLQIIAQLSLGGLHLSAANTFATVTTLYFTKL